MTASTSGVSLTQVMTMSLAAANSAGLAAANAPAAANGSARARVRFHTVTGKPARNSKGVYSIMILSSIALSLLVATAPMEITDVALFKNGTGYFTAVGHLAPTETELVLPAPPPGLRSAYRKVRSRGAWDFALAGVALALVFEGDTVASARVFLSGAAPVPWRARGVEAAITGTALDDATIAKAAAAAIDGAEPLSDNAYKLPLFEGIVAEQLEAIRKV